MLVQKIGSISLKINSILNKVIKDKIKFLVPSAKAQLSRTPNGIAALGSIKVLIKPHFHSLTPPQSDIIASHILFELMRFENQGVTNQVTALQQAGASQEVINKVVQGSQMESLIKAFELQNTLNKTLHDMQLNLIQNLKG